MRDETADKVEIVIITPDNLIGDHVKFCVNWSNFATSERNYTKLYAVSMIFRGTSYSAFFLWRKKNGFCERRYAASYSGSVYFDVVLDIDYKILCYE